jgi:hypothetical protein
MVIPGTYVEADKEPCQLLMDEACCYDLVKIRAKRTDEQVTERPRHLSQGIQSDIPKCLDAGRRSAHAIECQLVESCFRIGMGPLEKVLCSTFGSQGCRIEKIHGSISLG